jgi:predicted ATPase/class 3 adenylate cyclase
LWRNVRKGENRRVQEDLPTGTVTFLFTDIEGSTRLLAELGDAYADVLAEHRRVLRDAWRRHDGIEVDTQGDAFFVAFARASDAVVAAAEAQLELEGGPMRVRMGLHTGEPLRSDEGYVGVDVHRAARIAAVGHGGQVLLSQSTVDLAGVVVRDLGLHRLKDLSAPERIFQLGTNDFPPLKTLQETNLPIPATPFLGREGEIDQIGSLLRRPEVRLVTLTGPGGSGKTRLALQAAGAAADDYDRGVWWVQLSSLSDPALVATTAAQVLGSKDTLAATVGDQRLLLVLDNFEHVLGAAGVVSDTIGSCPRLTVLVTSREPLHVDGEWEVAVDPLQEREAVDLFVQRALAVDAGFAANGEVAEICRHLDCLPLAIELAAARVKALSPAVLLERLEQRLPLLTGGSRSAPERQRTLRATIAWSHDLLIPAEQELFARLAVFAGGCTLEAAEEICAADVDAITALVDRSLLRRTGDRYWMLETIREFAAEKLNAMPDASDLRHRHAAWFTALGEQAGPELRARQGPEWLDRLEAEHANIRAALEHLVASGDHDAALRLVAPVWHYWAIRGYWTEGRRVIGSVLAISGDRDDPEFLIEGMWGAAILSSWQGEHDETERWALRMLDLAERVGSKRGKAIGLQVLGIATGSGGDREAARPIYEESLELARDLDDPWFLSVATNNLGAVYESLGDLTRAAELYEESLAIGEARGDLERRARELYALGDIRRQLGDNDAALTLHRRALTAAVEIGAVAIQAVIMYCIALCEAALGDVGVAARLIGQTEQLNSRLGATDSSTEDWYAEDLAPLRAALGEDRFEAELAAGAALSLEEAVDLALGK